MIAVTFLKQKSLQRALYIHACMSRAVSRRGVASIKMISSNFELIILRTVSCQSCYSEITISSYYKCSGDLVVGGLKLSLCC